MTRFQLIFTTLCAIMVLRGALRLWHGRVPWRSGLLALLVWSSAACAIAIPQSTVRIANFLGIGRGADLVAYIAILGGLAAGFYFYQRCRQLENLITEVIRRDALARAIPGGSIGKPS